MVEAIKEYVAG